jgi:nitroreductase
MALPQQCEDQALGYASGPMIGFDAPGMAREFSLAATEIPALLVTAGRAAPGNWPREPRLPPEAILSIV